MSSLGILSKPANIMHNADANPTLFRLRIFEEQWLEPHRASAQAGSSLDCLLAIEGEHWIRIGAMVGYFPDVKGRSSSSLKAPDAESSMIVEWMSTLEPPSTLNASSFSQALQLAREDLTVDQRSLLRLVVFASEKEWSDAIVRLVSFRRSLQGEGPASVDALTSLSWALDGDFSRSGNPSDAVHEQLPAGWRHGSMLALRERSTRAAQRIDAVIDERIAIMDALKEAVNSHSIDVDAISDCREAAMRQDWVRFDRLFRNRLMHGYRAYLSETLGAWEETLNLARLADNPSFPSNATPHPGYYPATVARCLKHLGRSAESRSKYLDSLQAIARSHDEDTALYVNNFLTLLIWRGELSSADQLAELNIRALSWIKDRWRYRWQLEHGCSSIAYLRLLQGHLDEASVLFDRAAHAWDDHEEDRKWIFDYYPYYRSELILLSDSTAHDDALAAIESLLEIATTKCWPESICRGHIQAAVVYADQASRLQDPEKLLLARERLNYAYQFTSGIHLPDVAIAYHIAKLKIDLTHREVDVLANSASKDLTDDIDRLEALVQESELSLALSEVIAARGIREYLGGSFDKAHSSYARALSVCRRQGYALAVSSPRSLVHWLGTHVGARGQSSPSGSSINLIELIGSELSDNWMIERLSALGAA